MTMDNDLEDKKRKAAEALSFAIQVALEVGLFRHAASRTPALAAGAQGVAVKGAGTACTFLRVGAQQLAVTVTEESGGSPHKVLAATAHPSGSHCLTCRRAVLPVGPIRELGAGRKVERKRVPDACEVPQVGLGVA
jgi:hypothetical protein